jgi:hypothetical protein
LTQRVVGPLDENNRRLEEVIQKAASISDIELWAAGRMKSLFLLCSSSWRKQKQNWALSNLTSREEDLQNTSRSHG